MHTIHYIYLCYVHTDYTSHELCLFYIHTLILIYTRTGDVLTSTTDIRTDCGYVLLSHSDRRALEADYETVVKLQPRLFTLSSDPTSTTTSTEATTSTDTTTTSINNATTAHEVEDEEEVRTLEVVLDKIAQDFKWGS